MNIKYIRQISNISGISIPIYLMILTVLFVLNISALKGENKSAGITTVIIDAGHGGKDPGAVVGKAKEKDIVLDIALRLGKLIKQGLPDVKVIYTRNADFFVPLYERAVIANNNNASLFISIHANYCSSPSIKGTETYILGNHREKDNLAVLEKNENSVILLEDDYTTHYEGFDPNSPESNIIFDNIQSNHFDQSLLFAVILKDIFRQHAQRADRDVRQAGFLVLRETAMPSVLIETGYLSNKSESAYLMTENGRETIASSIYRSLKNYKSKYESRLNLAAGERKTKSQEVNKVEVNKKINPEPNIENKEIKSAEHKQVNAPEIKEIRVSKNNEIKTSEPKELKSSDKKKIKAPKSKENAVAKKEIEHQKTIREEVKSSKKSGTNSEAEYSFALQIAASKVKLPLTSKIFKGIENIKEIQVGEYYKYFCLESKSLAKSNQNLLLIKAKIRNAFITGLKNGQPVTVKEAINHK
jgi:N-acetylmuramoyl-L-alanine amidase